MSAVASPVTRTLARAAGPDAIRRIAVLGNHLPRQCGIATFTTDLSDAIEAGFPGLECIVLAMNDGGRRHAYPARVRCEVDDGDPASYRHAASFLNAGAVDVVSVQHEYGIFGGPAGSHVLALLRELRMPIVTTLHTVLADPDPVQRGTMDELTRLSSRVVVMSTLGASLLRDVHGVPESKIDLIPHGIPSLRPSPAGRGRLGVEGKATILTFGLLSPDKGLEHVVDALPAILERHPHTVYVVLGATHPHVKEHDGERYRRMLEARARELGVARSVIFHNRFVSREELACFLGAADVYITPYLKPEQITSGTLAYAIGAGKAVVSTPYWYARELLADGRGTLVPFRDAAAIARAVVELFDDEPKRVAQCERARAFGRGMLWPEVARSYLASFARERGEHGKRLGAVLHARAPLERAEGANGAAHANPPDDLPGINLDHLRLMTDDTGLLQHACFNVPRYDEGYCLDDNARALLLMTRLESASAVPPAQVRALASRYLAFVCHAFNPRLGRFRNFMSFSRRWTEEAGSEDSHGRALWALGTVVGRSLDSGRRSVAERLFLSALPALAAFTSPRAWAFALLGATGYLRARPGEGGVASMRDTVAERLLDLYRRTRRREWPWFEDRVTYENARLPQALIACGSAMKHEEMITAGLQSLGWLQTIQSSSEGTFVPVGSNGFYVRGGSRASFDQQPVEACATVSACLEARRAVARGPWTAESRRAFGWFLGDNTLRRPLYDATTGGCRDGLHADRANENQGGESTLCFLLALEEVTAARRCERAVPVEPIAPVHPPTPESAP